MNAQSQFYLFLICTALGASGGVLYDFFYTIRTFLPKYAVRIACDILFCLCFGGIYLLVAVGMGFPALRAYFLFGCALGLFLYLKSFHKIVAISVEKVYNSFKLLRKEKMRCLKTKRETIHRKK